MLEELRLLCEGLVITLATQPSTVQLQSINKKNSENDSVTSIQFDAILQGNLQVLSGLADLNSLSGVIKKKSSIGLFISLDKAPEIEILVMQSQFKMKTASVGVEKFQSGLAVNVQVINNKKCLITVEV